MGFVRQVTADTEVLRLSINKKTKKFEFCSSIYFLLWYNIISGKVNFLTRISPGPDGQMAQQTDRAKWN